MLANRLTLSLPMFLWTVQDSYMTTTAAPNITLSNAAQNEITARIYAAGVS